MVSFRSLNGGTPRRLWLDRGKWMLEVVRHVNIGHDLVRPTTECLTGNRMIGSYFKSNPDQEALGRGALKLMQMTSGDGPRSYSAVGAEWVSSSLPPGALDGEDEDGPNLQTQLDALNMRITALVALQEGLLVRLARLEARITEGSTGNNGARRTGVRAALALEAAAVRETPAGPSGPAAPIGEAAAEPLESEAESEAEDEAESEAEDGAASSEPAPPEPAPVRASPEPVDQRARPKAELALPPVAELSKCIALLVGNGVNVEAAAPLAVGPDLQNCYSALIEDESGEPLGLILMDLRATVFLGGSLMMQPTEQLEQQFAAANPEQDSIAASAEICNALCAALNAAQDRYHVRTCPLEKLDLARHLWATHVETRRDLADSFGGRVAVLSMPGA